MPSRNKKHYLSLLLLVRSSGILCLLGLLWRRQGFVVKNHENGQQPSVINTAHDDHSPYLGLRVLTTSSSQEEETLFSDPTTTTTTTSAMDLKHAMRVVQSAGIFTCIPADSIMMNDLRDLGVGGVVPICHGETTLRQHSRRMEESSFWVNFIGALVCVTFAALAAGLTLGLLGLDPLMLLIRQRASDDEAERKAAAALLPVVQQHHRLLVTLLLMNSLANEALPIFLEALVPSPTAAILLSVTLVLFFGEILPSALFTGPLQMRIATLLLPLVRFAMILLYPIAMPIAKLLDYWLHDENDDGEMYNRKELSALIRIQYEERLVAKHKRKHERQEAARLQNMAGVSKSILKGDRVGALDFGGTQHRKSLRAATSQIDYVSQHLRQSAMINSGAIDTLAGGSTSPTSIEKPSWQQSNSLHVDEVVIMEGALQMKTKVALDVFTPMRHVFAVPETTLLSEKSIVSIYASGFSRIPVYRKQPGAAMNDKRAIVGVLMTRQLIVVNPNDQRPLASMPLYTPICVSPQMPLVDLLNLFQETGGGVALQGGHLALVCARPQTGNRALSKNQYDRSNVNESTELVALPENAGLMGIISLEDVLESLLQEQIYDENDKYEKDGMRLNRLVSYHWKRYVGRKMMNTPRGTSMHSVVEQAMQTTTPTETTSLLS